MSQPSNPAEKRFLLAVAGAHLRGEPLHHQLTTREAVFVRACRTDRAYRFFALTGTVPEKPGLVRTPGFAGPGIEVELFSLAADAFGSFVDEVPAPLAIGSVLLEDGTTVNGFVCEPYALENGKDITTTGGWRAYLGHAAPV
jgi:allophanate hydrolase